MKDAVVTKKAGSNYSAYVPDLPGCVAAADTVQEAHQLIEEAIHLHLEAMTEGDPIPAATTIVDAVEVATGG